ncbi:unnamed protein product [Chilo suppressalis]|uniref:C-type lectin domain-containing protein n=1 Tax=Chilo suppressalis TaxID=168631 RepID=A0ABN8AR37_CHISP|nr:unnamed protein product [Chilo suppressalis]
MQLVFICVVFLSIYLNTSIATYVTEPGTGKTGFRHDYQYRKDAKGWFKFHQIPATWENARIKCFHEGAVLASPLNKEIHTVMQDILKDERQMAFTGIQSLTSVGDYFSIEGVHFSEMPIEWRADEPNNLGDEEHCLAMWRDGTLADVSCANTRSYICYKNKTSDLFINSCGTSDQAYLEVSHGQCYKFHPECLSWKRAHVVCSAEGGHLAVINSAAEARLLQELYAKKFETISRCNSIFMHFGFRNPEENDSPYWFTIDGQTLEEAGFAVWAPNQPDNFHSVEYCGTAVFRNATDETMMALNDIGCSTRLSFICEINGARTPYNEQSEEQH